MKPSEKQQKIYDTWVNTTFNLLIEAVAGGSKSTVLLELGKLSTHKSCLYLAFNKTIQLELEEKIKQNNMNHCSALTLHGLGLSMITKVKDVEVNDGKIYNLIYEIVSNNKWLYKLKSDTRNELDFLRYALIDCNNISRLYLTSDLDEIEKYGFIMGKIFSYDIVTQAEKDRLFQKYRKIFPSDEEVINSPEYNDEYQSTNRRKFTVLWNKLYELREKSYNEDKIVIDFLDMIYLPVIKSVPVPTQYQYMFIDEAQDLSMLQHKFIDKFINEGQIERYAVVGDSKQSIYLFAGAFSKSFDLFRDKPGIVELPLDINYRCSTNIIQYANEVYNNLLPFKTSEGVVKHIKEADYTKREDNLYKLEDIVRNIDDDCLIICRNTKPLIQLYFNLLSVNRTPSFVGNDILNSVVNFLKPYKKDTIKTFKEELRDSLKVLVAKKDNSDKNRLEYLLTKNNNETFNLIQNRLNYTDNMLVDNIITDLKLKLSRKGDIKLCTIHKSKGLEHDVVYLLNENLIPSKFALTEEALVQEKNLRYVARTRAKNSLYLLNLKDTEKNTEDK